MLELLACGEPLPLAVLERLSDAASIEAAEGRGLAVSERVGERVQVPRGLAGMDGDALCAAATVFGDLGHVLLAAEAVSTAARAYRKDGLSGKSAIALERAAVLRGRCEGATTPLLGHGGTAVLTRREREVALLAARYSSKHVAARLGLSVATVNNNLARVYVKLGISNRSQLAALVDGNGRLE
ncbi:helix-turn-helix transcriptional regulator [Nonomuraea sp. B12E4]|uniref:helix-turn-helix transcriptional regulator n=1 Tax=Nonomuraea sp. B12E4 TaxID=3153564 RepID=UPI00325EC3E6